MKKRYEHWCVGEGCNHCVEHAELRALRQWAGRARELMQTLALSSRCNCGGQEMLDLLAQSPEPQAHKADDSLSQKDPSICDTDEEREAMEQLEWAARRLKERGYPCQYCDEGIEDMDCSCWDYLAEKKEAKGGLVDALAKLDAIHAKRGGGG